MLRVAVCEDELIHRTILEEYLHTIFEEFTNQYEILGFSSGEQLLENYLEGLDILLLDIQMNKLTGMDVARKVREFDNKVEIIFITSLIDYVQEGYEVRAYRYLLKPIKYEDLKKHIVSCIDKLIKSNENFMIIQGKSEVHKVSIDTITYIEVIKKDMIIHTTEQSYNTKMSLYKMEKELAPYDFFRCHKSYLVNMKQIQCLKQNVAIVNDEEIPVSRYRIKNLKIKLAYVLGDILC
ncbi:two-component signal transduction response regulator, LytTR family [Gottschalkia purinilytica]|uniref:Two-component signal transduction response regulator, LytTR family n=1 Tax=Gottschalkia purinilytica TaxID=1503 RepID=A0A0L0W8N9_GOTPU|nr:LytTR family DNA-binding domain-containing protein [Gottschalkia purinilytica]KNF07928.1 two-component signal transduction response regulator, LytTR family [Gottschalkia purinilytica]